MALFVKLLAIAASSSSSSSSLSSPSTSVIPSQKHDVFLSFRGVDTRDNFVCHLNVELRRRNIETYMDDGLERGEKISKNLFEAIEKAKVCLIIFSENYASSSWCLDELVHILKCEKRTKLVVIPIFYGVEPSSVRKQSGSFKTALANFEKCLEGRKISSWKDALSEAGAISGWDSRKFRPDNILIEEIVKDVVKKLNLIRPQIHDIEDAVQSDEQFERIKSWKRKLKKAVS